MTGNDELRILLIEDNPGDARLLEEMLREAEIVSTDVQSGVVDAPSLTHAERLSTGVQQLEDTAVDVILLDLDLPDSSGFETLESVIEVSAGAPIIVLTGLQDHELALRAIQRGAQDYLAKDQATSGILSRSIQYAIERKHREDQLAALNDLSRELMDAESPQDVCDSAVEAAQASLDIPVVTINLYDEEAGAFELCASTPQAEMLEAELRFRDETDLVWQAFVDNEVKVYDDYPIAVEALTSESTQYDGLAIPLGKHGVLTAGTVTGTWSDADIDRAKILAANIETALDRAKREQLLRERDRTLQQRNVTLDRLNRINEVIREITQVLVQATTREEIEQAVCDKLASLNPSTFAWIGERDAVNDRIVPRARAGAENGYLDAVTVTIDERPTEGEPTGTAVRTRDSCVVQNVHADPPFESWRKEALKRDYRSVVSIPLVYGDSVYGVMSVYADEPNAFEEMEQAVLAELGTTVAYAINGIETRQALLTDKVVELDLNIRNPDDVLLDLACEAGCRIDFEGTIPQSEESATVFFTASGAPAEEILETARESLSIDTIRLVGEGDDERLFEATVLGSTVVSMLAEHGAVAQTVDPDGGDARVTIELPQAADVRSFVEMFRTRYPETEFVARRDHNRPMQTQQEFQSRLDDRLTDRQQEVLKTAYFSGFFESPRRSTKEDIADSLGVSQPTINHHLRVAQRKLFTMLLGE